jgi:hypothetical protein
MTERFIFHILSVSTLNFLYFNFFLASFSVTFLSDGIATSISEQMLPVVLLIMISTIGLCFYVPASPYPTFGFHKPASITNL